ncbi:DUF1003 domain-containing protein [Sphingomonas adhaesiva]|uniref:DUF1003 domain-containing protein n=1 Tax=Sphingomonas adhaesiva TaxID=28212 RepID=A0A2A4I5F8_9SPHN|nr:DUF1003 domain-containing protein [Sphingomonas adhaesiva]PCG13264.1 DUF1003 domain-containing protein [Sphingomonas adhaesiva]
MASNPLHLLAARLIGKTPAALDAEERHVLVKMQERRPIARDAADVADERATLGDRLADRVAAVGGSWGFIIAFTLVLIGWMVLNSDVLTRWGQPFDPYPYIFLNLMLSTLAAVQAPIIMMSQNRQAAKDRLAASLDYEVNLRTELEMLRMHEVIDQSIAARLDELLALVRAQADGGERGRSRTEGAG